MVCPTCGRTERHMIAPGYFKCTHSWVTREVVGFDPRFGPAYRDVQHTCGETYQEDPGEDVAFVKCTRCGLGRVGICDHCSKPFCGAHAAPYEGQFLCYTEISARVTAHRAEQEAATAARRAQAEAESREAAAAAAAAAAALVERRVHSDKVASVLAQNGSPELVRQQYQPIAALARTEEPKVIHGGYLAGCALLATTVISTFIYQNAHSPGLALFVSIASIVGAIAIHLEGRSRKKAWHAAQNSLRDFPFKVGCADPSCQRCPPGTYTI